MSRRGRFRSEARGASAIGASARGASAIGALALGSLALGAFAVGAVAIYRLAIRRLAIGESRIGSLKIGNLEVGRLSAAEIVVTGSLELPAARASEPAIARPVGHRPDPAARTWSAPGRLSGCRPRNAIDGRPHRWKDPVFLLPSNAAIKTDPHPRYSIGLISPVIG